MKKKKQPIITYDDITDVGQFFVSNQYGEKFNQIFSAVKKYADDKEASPEMQHSKILN